MLLKIICILCGIGLFWLVVFLVYRVNTWQVLEVSEESIVGTRVEGDPTAPPTRWWNHLYLLLWGWNKVAVFSLKNLKTAYGAYYIGYFPFQGPARITIILAGSHVRMRIGHEPRTFFALDLEWNEISLQLVGVFDKRDPIYVDILLL